MNPPHAPKPDGAQQKRAIVSTITDAVRLHAELPEGEDLSLAMASVATAAYHYSVGVYGSAEIAARTSRDPAFEAWRVEGCPSAEAIAGARTGHLALLRRCLIDALGWAWNVPLKSQVTGEATMSYAERVVSGRQQQFKSQAQVAAEADARIAQAEQCDAE